MITPEAGGNLAFKKVTSPPPPPKKDEEEEEEIECNPLSVII